MLASVLSATAIGVGLTMLLAPDTYRASPSFVIAFAWATPSAWGALYLIAAIAVLAVIFYSPRIARLPVFMLGLIFAVQGLMVIPTTVNGEGLPSAIFMYLGMGWISLITQMVCGIAAERNYDAQASVHYQP
jgi:hypothetical protein